MARGAYIPRGFPPLCYASLGTYSSTALFEDPDVPFWVRQTSTLAPRMRT